MCHLDVISAEHTVAQRLEHTDIQVGQLTEDRLGHVDRVLVRAATAFVNDLGSNHLVVVMQVNPVTALGGAPSRNRDGHRVIVGGRATAGRGIQPKKKREKQNGQKRTRRRKATGNGTIEEGLVDILGARVEGALAAREDAVALLEGSLGVAGLALEGAVLTGGE